MAKSNDKAEIEMAVGSLTANVAWQELMDIMEKDLPKIELALQQPGEFEHGKNIGRRMVTNWILDFPKWAVENLGSNGMTRLR